MKINSPCKDCPDRYFGCHDHCDRFAEYREKKDKQKEAINKEKQTTYFGRDKIPSTYVKAKHYYRYG